MGVNNFGFPRQAIPDSEKTQEWCEDNLKAITKYLGAKNSNLDNFLSDRNKDIANYSLYNGHVNPKDYEYITDQYGLPFPARMSNFPLIQTKIDLLINEDASRPIDKKVTVTAIIIPKIPNKLPCLDVSGEDKPLSARIKSIPETK